MDSLTTISPDQIPDVLQQQGWAALSAPSLLRWLPATPAQADEVHAAWNDLPPDTHLRDGGRYRFRRHGCFVFDLKPGQLSQTPHRAHWQPVDYNALHGGYERWFEPIHPAICAHPMWVALLSKLSILLNQARPVERWHIEAHQFRVDTAGGIGRPTPEGAHRDGVDFVAVLMLERHGIKGGETRVFEADGPHGVRFTLTQPWSLLLLDDRRVIHESTPIQPLDGHGWRDTLVLTFRQEGFQDPVPTA